MESPEPRKAYGRKSPDTQPGFSRNLQMATQIATQHHATEKKSSLLTGGHGQYSILNRDILKKQEEEKNAVE